MNAPSPDGPPAESPLDVERVEWVPSSPETVRVLVVGRWRTAAPAVAPVLIVEDGDRVLFAADDHGVVEGAWRAAFTVPIEVRPRLEHRLALAVGDAEIPLPAASAGPADEAAAPPPATIVDRSVLDERRARRFEGAEESLVRRAQAAEATAATLRTQLEHLEERLREAVDEREALTRDLRTAEQREEAERRVRLEAQEERDSTREDADRRVGALRTRLRAAELHASELARQMDAVRREGAEAQQAAVAARRAAERAEGEAAQREAELAARLEQLGAEAGGVGERLASERAAREAAESALAAERERLVALEAEVQRRASLAGAVRSELEQLRADLGAVREQARSGGEAAELRATVAGLRARVEELERGERAAREDLERRAAELERARAALEAARAEVADARDAEAARAAALREAERAADDVRREAAEARRRVEDERRRRFEVEAELRAELEREREELGSRLSMAEGTLRAQVAAERRAFEEQVAAIERTARELRERLAEAARELEERVGFERAAREEAMREASRLRAELDDRVAREAEVGALVRDLLETSTNLREGFESELRGLEDEIRGRLGDEREVLRTRLEEVERHVALLREELERERAARAEVEAALVAERESRPPTAASETELADIEQAKSRLADAERHLEQAHAREDLHAQARAMIRNLEDAERRLRAEREALSHPATPEPGAETGPRPSAATPPAPSEAPADAPAPPTVEPRPSAAAPPATSEPSAAAPSPSGEPRLPAATPPAREPFGAAPSTPPAPPGDEPEAASDDPGATALERAAAELAAAQRAAAERAAARRAARRAAPPLSPEPLAAGDVVEPRIVALEDRRPTTWLLTALERIAATEPSTAARLITGLLPAQGPLLTTDLTYALEVDGDGAFRVELGGGAARVEPQPPGATPAADIEVRVAGPPAVLAPLVAGGAPRRLRGARIHGRRRRLRPLLKARRAPVTLVELAGLGVPLDPLLILRALAVAIDPAWTAGHRFAVAFEIGGASPGVAHVAVADGGPVVVAAGRPAELPAATVTAGRAPLVALLARIAPPQGDRALLRGDPEALDHLLRWTDRAQGIPEAD